MIENISVVTVLFDYPSNYIPTFYKKAEEYFTKENIHIARFNNLIQTKCYYEKLYYYKVEKFILTLFAVGFALGAVGCLARSDYNLPLFAFLYVMWD